MISEIVFIEEQPSAIDSSCYDECACEDHDP